MAEKEISTDEDVPEVFPFIRGKTIDLCSRNSKYAKLYAKWKNNPKVRKYSRNVIPRSLEQEKKRFERRGERFKDTISLDIWHKKDKKPIGECGLGWINWVNGWANTFLSIGEPEYWNKNIATEATELLVEYAFNELNLNKLQGGAAVENIGSWRVAEKVGFKFEGIQKANMYVNGKYHDGKTYCILKEDWMNRKNKNE
ncbi:MAG: GNAT family N-acetyltransferase [Candidatus Lokiarchaeota archaeon]|nr:GNAT family N-acetyltransferase [Candidatus Lokiarchaeota archaeon]